MYSTSHIDNATMGCFLEDQVQTASPKLNTKPIMLFLSSRFSS